MTDPIFNGKAYPLSAFSPWGYAEIWTEFWGDVQADLGGKRDAAAASALTAGQHATSAGAARDVVLGAIASANAANDLALTHRNESRDARDEAEDARDAAASYAAGLHLPPVTSADAGKALKVKPDGSGYETGSIDALPSQTGQAGKVLGTNGTVAGWVAAGMANPMTAAGDIIVGGVGGSPTVLHIGSEGDQFVVSGGVPKWSGLATGAWAVWLSDVGVNTGQTDVWTDQVAGHKLSQSTSGNRPTYTTVAGVPCLDFDGTNDVLATAANSAHDLDGATALTFQMLVQSDLGSTTAATAGALLFWVESGSWGATAFSPVRDKVYWRTADGYAGRSVTITPTFATSDWYIVTFRKNGTAEDIFINRTNINSATEAPAFNTNSSNVLQVGFGNTDGTPSAYYNGRVAFIGLWRRALLNSEISNNARWLGARFGLAL